MTPDQWITLKYFNPIFDKFGDAAKMDYCLLVALDALREYVGKPIVIHCGYEARQTGGQHPLGRAVDCHIVGMSLFDQYMNASRFSVFTGIGVYPWWNSPGLHLDNREIPPLNPRSLWGSKFPGKKGYCDLSKQFLQGCF